MNIPSKLVVAGLMIGAIAMVQAASAAGSLNVSSSASANDCGPNTFLCRIGTTPECVGGHWTCTPTDSSSSSSLPCGPLTMLCIIGKVPQCSDGHWSCVTPSSSSASSMSSESSASSLPCGALNLMCMMNTTPECSDGHWTCVPNQTRQRPSITSIAPISGPAGTTVTITGKNFTSNDTVYFGNSRLTESSADGTHITFTVPATFTIPCLQNPPYCKIATYMLKPGLYRVRVVTSGGFSNVKPFRLLSGSVSSSSSSASSVSSVVGDSCTCPAGQAWDATKKTCIAHGTFMCPMYMVVGGWCGCDGKVYANSCFGAAAGVKQGQNCNSNSVPVGSASSVH